MGKTRFQPKWKKGRPWLKEVDDDIYSAQCLICLKRICIDNSGIAQVNSHGRLHADDSSTLSGQSTLVVSGSKVSLAKKEKTPKKSSLTIEDQVANAEVLEALHLVQYNQSFSSAATDNGRFKKMFPDSQIAQGYKQGKTKVGYTIKYGLAPYITEKLVKKMRGIPFTFKFDETTTAQVKKQYDGYVQFWCSDSNEVINTYCGSLFVGHCDSDALLEHFLHFMHKLKLDLSLLLAIGMDGPNVNLSFERKLRNHLEATLHTNILDIGTCSLHPAHTAFRKGLSCLSFDVDAMLHNLHFFFKLSSARREDYAKLENLTEIIAKFMLRHIDSRWLSMKNVAVRVLQQFPNLKEYFLTFLPKSKGFKPIAKTDRYQSIASALKDPLAEFYIAFSAFTANEFEAFLVPFQSDEPKIHLLYPGICKLVSGIRSKFIKSKYYLISALTIYHCLRQRLRTINLLT